MQKLLVVPVQPSCFLKNLELKTTWYIGQTFPLETANYENAPTFHAVSLAQSIRKYRMGIRRMNPEALPVRAMTRF